ncbi:hypothetical protein MCHI_003562 [Candidatus Magnetoovum chiemensis]|nr:hypothetical protein MCHI_003562 [Candidatus Magnetoovum chiemensis]
MAKLKLLTIIAVLSLFFVSIQKAQCEDTSKSEYEKKAVEAALKWLETVDSGKYGDNWNSSASYFKNAVTQKDWAKSLIAVRAPLGKTIKREVLSKQYTNELPGAPDGKYVVIQFTTSFENKQSAVETVTPMLDKDGDWRVSGYYIK